MEEKKCKEECSRSSCDSCSKAMENVDGENCNSNVRNGSSKKNDKSNIGKVIAVMSGKGGVGKSFVTSSIAVALSRKGYKVGILDSDVTGPSIPKMFGMHELVTSDGEALAPIVSSSGIKVISVNLLLPDQEEPVIWRGPVISSVVRQFFDDVYWGDLDYLLIDMPPGTGDVPLTVFQSLPVDGAIVVTSPQELVQLIVKKAYHMAEKMNVSVFGVIENFSYLECPDCGKKIEIFGKSSIDETAKELGLKVLGKLPVVPQYAQLADEGRFDEINVEYLQDAVESLIK